MMKLISFEIKRVLQNVNHLFIFDLQIVLLVMKDLTVSELETIENTFVFLFSPLSTFKSGTKNS
jgi:hypothetical protein